MSAYQIATPESSSMENLAKLEGPPDTAPASGDEIIQEDQQEQEEVKENNM